MIRSWAKTDPGPKRRHNEDRLLNRPDIGLWAVADGAGGHQAGDVAATMVIEALDALPSLPMAADMLGAIRQAVTGADARIRREAARRGSNVVIATTLVCLVIRNGYFACLWAGDSRAYLYRDGMLSQITQDHSLVQELVDAGQIRPENAESHPHANIITRAIGAGEEDLVLDKVIGKLHPGDSFLLCSDGITKTLNAAELSASLSVLPDLDPTTMLISAALAHKATDNVTAVVITCDRTDSPL
ncbi:protein phosphatase 2C domain-containing protein [Acetobacter sp. TBRC 12305]|uniref:Serine/threonine-protein phosphatase n=1 Tax=Acetobacter garciniae TaxID=2817435 RepID=A0A939KP71_9PROT|nr:protein phosphatase 2C domain-containing protein [Acetobacter garciniae]MBO1326500.1 serine/threonine-protein phosphatase [Acetobacter garciniae]MBX0346184.1 protein phosphatase 2C domain-containing protein [Acetobacter garciniae]